MQQQRQTYVVMQSATDDEVSLFYNVTPLSPDIIIIIATSLQDKHPAGKVWLHQPCS